MTTTKVCLTALALAIAIAVSPVPEVQAATFAGPGSQPGTENVLQSAKIKKEASRKRAKKAKKRMGAKGKKVPAAARSCGTFKYHKGGKCLDARDKK